MVHVHELLKTFHSLGCNDEALCYAACRVYIHLQEEKRMRDVRYHYAEHLNLIYLTANRESEANASDELFIPALATEEVDLAQLNRYRDGIVLPDGKKPGTIVLAICAPSSTVLLYRVTPGLKAVGEKLPSKGYTSRLHRAGENRIVK
uniref:tRNA-splicing endonuclease subunit Sen15 domain-containing protein n=1 Tax=Anopheles dirus TaxID=7168 RepID=A0A182NHH9_9DIPT